MPGITIERPKMTRAMYQSLKKHIMRERERKKQEQEQDKAKEQMRKDLEMRKKKEQEDTLTLEQTKEQINSMESRLETLKSEKHELFSQLKKVLHQEDENRKRAQIKEHNELLNIQSQYNATVSVHPVFMQAHIQQRANKYLNMPVPTPMVGGVKRPRSPTPPPTRPMFPHYGSNKYPATTSYSSQMKREDPYPSTAGKVTSYPSTQVTYAIQSGQPFPQQQMPHHQGIPPHPTPSQQHSSQSSQAPPPVHKPPPPSHQAPPPVHKGPPPSHQPPPPSHQVPPPSHQAPPPSHQPGNQHALPSQHPPSHQVPPPGSLQGPPKGHQAPPPSQQIPAPPPPHHNPGQPASQGPPPPPHHQQAPPTQHQGGQSQPGKYVANQSAFQSYPTNYPPHQSKVPDRMPQGYPVPRVPKPGYMPSPHSSSSLSLQQQLEHANQKSGFSEEKFKLQQPLRSVTPMQQPPPAPLINPGQLPTSQSSGQQVRKGSIATGYPIRTQASSTNYQPVSTQQSTHSPHSSVPRHSYGGQRAYYGGH